MMISLNYKYTQIMVLKANALEAWTYSYIGVVKMRDWWPLHLCHPLLLNRSLVDPYHDGHLCTTRHKRHALCHEQCRNEVVSSSIKKYFAQTLHQLLLARYLVIIIKSRYLCKDTYIQNNNVHEHIEHNFTNYLIWKNVTFHSLS